MNQDDPHEGPAADAGRLARRQRLRTATAVLVAAAVALLGVHAFKSSKAPTQTATQLSAFGDQLGGLGLQPAQQPAAAPGTKAKALAAATHQVMIMNFKYSPSTLTINPGDTVTWTNEDTAPHTVTVSSGPETINSPTLQKGQTFTYTFTKSGTYSYYCALHPDMKATVTVTGAGGTPPPNPGPCNALNKSVDAFLQHFYAAHLQRGPLDQVLDIVDVNQYVKTHTVLIQNIIEPQLSAVLGGATTALNAFLVHLYAAHLERSPQDQVADIANLDQYVKTHTVLVESMIQPFLNAEVGSC